MKIVVMLNGLPRSGKDTAADMLKQGFAERGYIPGAFSSIEPVREMLLWHGIDVRNKTEADRLVLSTVGDAVEAHSDFRTNACVDFAVNLFARSGKAAVILHTREPDMIRKIGDRLTDQYGAKVVSVFIAGRGDIITTNRADRGVHEMTYDHEIDNSTSLDELRYKMWRLVQTLTGQPNADAPVHP